MFPFTSTNIKKQWIKSDRPKGKWRTFYPLMPHRGNNVAIEDRYLEIVDFTLFFDHFVFTPNAENVLEKELKKEIPVSVGIELVVVDMSENVDFMG